MSDNLRTWKHGELETSTRSARFGRALFLFCGGLLMSILVSCACGPVR